MKLLTTLYLFAAIVFVCLAVAIAYDQGFKDVDQDALFKAGALSVNQTTIYRQGYYDGRNASYSAQNYALGFDHGYALCSERALEEGLRSPVDFAMEKNSSFLKNGAFVYGVGFWVRTNNRTMLEITEATHHELAHVYAFYDPAHFEGDDLFGKIYGY